MGRRENGEKGKGKMGRRPGMVKGGGEEGGGEGGDAFGAACEAEVLGGGGFYGDAVDGDAEVLSYVGSHLLDVGEHFGGLGDDGDVDVGYGVAFFTDEAQALAQK